MKKASLIIAATVALLFVVAGIVGPSNDQKSRDRYVIAECWKDHERKSFDAGAKQFVAGACEALERKFRETHGTAP